MNVRGIAPYLRDTALRLLPHRAPTGLVRIGNPDRTSPVLLTGNFTLTVRRLREVLAGHTAWLLVADSRGINVWCAAGGGHLTHHDVISVLRTSGIGDLVDHRDLILPQLAATGVERRPIESATGWRPRWGPARLEDLPAYLARGGRVTRSERRIRFPLWERLEMAVIWVLPMALLGAPGVALFAGWKASIAALIMVVLTVGGVFAALPRLRVTGYARWLTYGLGAAFGICLATGTLALLDAMTPARLVAAAAASVVAMAVLSIDLTGSTPWYPGTVNSVGNRFTVDLVADRCSGAAYCLQVCPRAVLHLDGSRRTVEIVNRDACIACGACIVQCPEDALRFLFTDGRTADATTVRRTRLNLLGRRTVEVGE